MADEIVRKTTTRKRVAKTTTRKAPTHSDEPEVTKASARSYTPFIVVAVFVVLVGGSVAIGFSDDGQINVSHTINDRKINGTPEEQSQIQNIPVQQNRSNKPLGGLVPSKAENKPPEPQVEAASTTASSSEETASSTEESSTDTGEVSSEVEETTSGSSEEATEPEPVTPEETPAESTETPPTETVTP